ncbi:hypothetical protein H7142_03760 [Candidatus Saccharibacteria bacterium]|nr:hypothetical protein [Candidatus Saccharibacteria bacterium]
MAGSRQEVRHNVLERLEPGVTIKGGSFGELRDQLGIAREDVSNTQFSKAVRSLHYHHDQITYGREWSGEPGEQTKGHYISLR